MSSQSSGTMTVGHREIKYVVNERTSAKTVLLRLKPDFVLEVSVPHNSGINISSLLRKKRSWIARRSDAIVDSKRIFDGRQLLYRGVYCELRFVASRTNRIRLAERTIVVPNNTRLNLSQALKDWMQQQTEELLEKKLPQLARRFHLKADRYVVRDMKKWAHCTRDRRLVFNSQLTALPDKLVDYVVLHELVHLREFNHSSKFKTALFSVCPDYREREQALKYFLPL